MTEPIEDLNEALRDVEDAFDERQFGVSTEVDLDGESRLAWIKHGQEWQLVIRQASSTDSMPRVPLFTTSKRLRVLAAKALPSLYDALRKVKDAQDEEMRAATAAMRALAERVRADAPLPNSTPQDGNG